MNYGIGYKGSKNKLAERIVNLFPPADNFYDLFCGGCSITHRALLTNKFKNYYINDLDPLMPKLFLDAIHGKYKNETRWISREDFKKLKDTDGYVKVCWSFGNNGNVYLYDEKLEPYKKAIHYAVMFNDCTQLKTFLNADYSFLDSCKNFHQRKIKLQRFLFNSGIAKGSPLESCVDVMEISQNINRLEALERLQSLEALERLQRFGTTSCGYDEVKINPNSVIYCDIPYKNTDGYNGIDFDFDKFYSWCKEQKEPVFISSYEMPLEHFEPVDIINHRCTLAAEVNNAVTEKVFIPKHQVDLYRKLQPQPSLFADMW